MALVVDLIDVSRAYTSVVRIAAPGMAPRYWMPFASGLTAAAWPLDDGSVLAVGQNGGLAVYDLGAGSVIDRADTESFPGAFLTADRTRLVIFKTYTLSLWSTRPLTCLGSFDAVETDASGGRLVGGGRWFDRASTPPGATVTRLHTYGGIGEHGDGRLLVSLFDDGQRAPGAILVIDPATAAVEVRDVRQGRSLAGIARSWLGGGRDGSLDAAVSAHHAANMKRWREKTGAPPPTRVDDPAAETFVDAAITHRIALADLEPPSVVAALDAMTTGIETTGLANLLVLGQLDYTFVAGGKALREREFFDHLVTNRTAEAIPALRRLLTAYHASFEGGEGSQPRNEYIAGTPTGGLAHGMRALLWLDPRGSQDMFRTYIAKRDGEHETYATETIYPEYVARFGIETEDDIRLAVAVALNIIWGGRGPEDAVWRDHGLIEIARRMLPPERFAEIVTAEVRALDLEPQWDFQDSQGGYYLRTLLDAVPGAEPFGRRLRDALARTWPEFADAIRAYTAEP